MKKLLICLVCVLLFNCRTSKISTSLKKKLTRPNIILFLVDDMGWQDTSVPFYKNITPNNKKFYTPNMEALAKKGVKFTQAYATAICSPTRTSLMTGMNAARHRVTNWTLNKNESKDHKDSILEYPKWNMNGLQPTTCQDIPYTLPATTFVELLRQNGYFTIHAGKAHWGVYGTPGENPLNLGFQVNIAGNAIGGPASYLAMKNFGQGRFHVTGLEKYYGQDIFLTEAITKDALKKLEDPIQRNQPFYLYMSHYAVHIPLDKDKRFYQKYIDRGLDPKEAAYAALVEGMDKSLGDILHFLEEKKIADNTVIIFMSDNGGLSQHGRGGVRNTHNLPLRSGKGSAYEGGIRVPMIVYYPNVTQPNSENDTRVIIEDFYPTILDIAGVKNYKTVQEIDGNSFLNLIKGEHPQKVKDMVWHYPNKWINVVDPEKAPGIDAYSVIRSGDWKLIYYYRDGRKELFNIKQDIKEENNLANIEKRKTQMLSSKLGKYLRKVNAQRPSFKASNKLCPWPDEVK